jgi:microcystin-dependent protein
MADPFVAEIRMMANNFAPRGWAFCNGQLLQISQNTALFSLIGTTYGGDGRTTTALPNLQGRLAMHPGRGPGLTPRNLGQRGGVTTVALTEAQVPAHSHAAQGVDENADSTAPGGKYFAIADDDTYRGSGTGVNMAADSITVAGGGQPHNNMQPHLGINYCIALVGVYPSRS